MTQNAYTDRGATWRYDERLEGAITMSRDEPERFAALSPTIKTALGYYEVEKAAAQAAGRDTTGGESR